MSTTSTTTNSMSTTTTTTSTSTSTELNDSVILSAFNETSMDNVRTIVMNMFGFEPQNRYDLDEMSCIYVKFRSLPHCRQEILRLCDRPTTFAGYHSLIDSVLSDAILLPPTSSLTTTTTMKTTTNTAPTVGGGGGDLFTTFFNSDMTGSAGSHNQSEGSGNLQNFIMMMQALQQMNPTAKSTAGPTSQLQISDSDSVKPADSSLVHKGSSSDVTSVEVKLNDWFHVYLSIIAVCAILITFKYYLKK